MSNNDIFNWYENPVVRRMLPQEQPYPFENTHIKVNSRILVVGQTGTGKTQALLHFIAKMPNTFRKIIIFHKEMETLYEFLKEHLQGAIEFHTKLSELPKLAKLREDYEDEDRILLVLDDWMLELKNYPNVNDYFIYGRKRGITVFCLAQDYYPIPKTLRNQMTYLILFKLGQQKDVNMIIRQFDTKEKVLLNIYEDATREPLNFLKIQTTADCPLNEKFSKNFLGFYKIKDD